MKKINIKKAISIFLFLTMVVALISSCSSSSKTDESNGSGTEAKLPTTPQAIGTHNTGTLFYLMGSGIASIISNHTPMRAVVQPYSGPSAWIPDLDSGAISFGVISYVEGAWTYLGNKEVPSTPKIRMVMRGTTLHNLA